MPNYSVPLDRVHHDIGLALDLDFYSPHCRSCPACGASPANYTPEDLPALPRCLDCARQVWSECVDCGDFYAVLDALCDEQHCASCCGLANDDDDPDYCSEEDNDTEPLVRDYGYRPSPRFHGVGSVHLGMELEVEVPYDSYRSCAVAAKSRLGSLGYLKEDTTISCGFEIVTHPMTHDYAAQSFPWEMLAELADYGAYGGDWVGIHVHVSRAGFDGPAHVYRWLKLIYRNEDAVSAIARRYSYDWAPFDSTARRLIKRYAKGDTFSGRRYAAVNVTNRDTFEVRVFASSLRVREVRAALDLVAGSVEYTRQLTVREIVAGGWTWDNFIDWAREQGDRYAALVHESERCVA